MNNQEKRRLREAAAVKLIENEIVLDGKLLRKQINTASKLTSIVNNEMGDDLTGAIMVLELFEWLPKGEYTIKFKVV